MFEIYTKRQNRKEREIEQVNAEYKKVNLGKRKQT